MIKIYNPFYPEPKLTYKCTQKTLFWGLILLILFGITSCDTTTTPKTGSLSGSVVLVNDTGDPSLDPIDYSGSTISCYEYKPAIEGIDEAVERYPHIGVDYDDTGYLLTTVKTPQHVTTSDSDGLFIIRNISSGVWIVKFSKEGWSDRYMKVTITYAEVSLTNVEMFRPQEVSGSYVGDIVIQPMREVLIIGDFVLIGNIIVNGPGIVKISSNSHVRILGSIIKDTEDLLIFTSTNPLQSRYYQFELINPVYDISFCLFCYAYTGLFISSNTENINLNRSVFFNCEAGYYSPIHSNVNVHNCIFASCTSEASTVAALNQHSPKAEILRNIFVNNKIGLRSANDVSSTISDNYFVRNFTGAESSYQTQDVISYNTFIDNEFYAIRTASLRSCVIEFNDISGPGGIQNFWFTTPGQAPQIHNNNINAAIYAIYTSSQAAAQDVDAAMNYFYTTSIDELNQLIWDENDRPLEYPTSYPAGYVIFVPYRTSRVVTAGIRY